MKTSVKTTLKQAVFSYWDTLQAQSNQALLGLISEKPYTSYGENQDFIASTVAGLMPKHGYIRAESVSVYFRAYKVKCRMVRQDLTSTIKSV